jgi:hypothetical protein
MTGDGAQKVAHVHVVEINPGNFPGLHKWIG